MSNYSQIKGIIDAAVYENHQQAITGDAMNTVLNGMVSQLGAHYRYEGYASPSTDPGTPDENVFYLATEQGAYPNFGNLSLTKPLGVFKWDGSWTLDQIAIDTGTAAGLLEKVNANTAAINAINAKIPPEASTDNKLADKAYVDRAVATNTGTFVGTFGSVSELPTDDIKANDYAYVVEDGVFKRYKYNGSEWLYEYSLDNTAFSDYVKAVNITAQGIVFDFAAGTDKTFLIASGGGLSYTGNGLEITSLKSSLVISALGYTPFDASQFTAQNIVSTLGNTAVKEALHALNADTAAVANKVAHPLYFYDADPEDSALQLVQLCWAQTEGGLAGQTAHVTLHDLYGWGDEGRSAEPIAAGTWELDVPLEYEDTSVELASGLETTFNGCDVTIDRLTLSAIGVHLEYTLSGEPLEVSRQGWEFNIPVVVTLRDGPSIDATWSGGSGETLEAGGTARMSKGMGFDRIIDVEDVASVRVGDLWIEPGA